MLANQKLDTDGYIPNRQDSKTLPLTSATRQVRQRWFSVCIFPPGLLFGLTGNRPQYASCHNLNR